MTQPRIRSRRIPGLRWWHKWVGISIGTILFIWVASGLIMLLAPSAVARRGEGNAPVDWSVATIAPAQAARAATAAAGGGTVQRIEFRRVQHTVAYLVRLDRGKRVLIDAGTGEPIRISAEVAGAIALEALPGAKVSRVERIPGNQPAWHVFLDDAAHTEAVVGEESGDIVRSQRGDRLKSFFGHDLHVFMPLRSLPGRDGTRLGSLWVTSLVSVVSILTGFYLGLPRRWRRWA